MADDEKSRLYQRIVQQTPDAVLLQRMAAHGFWPAGQGLPPEPPSEAAERERVTKELAELRPTGADLKEIDHALALERKRRWEASKKRRAERKAHRQAEARRRREAWEARRREAVTHLGAGVSAGLEGRGADEAALAARGLPAFHDAAQLAAALGVTVATLRWLTYHRKGATLVHYHRYDVAKKTGGARCISAPKPALDRAQHWVLEQILSKLAAESPAHGFVPGRSIVTNAAPHAGKGVVVNLDLKDFFPSVTFRRVKGLFEKFGYGEQVATVLALLCTEPPRVPAEVGGKRYYVALGERVLPQGACTSPALTNLLCRRLDLRLAGLAAKLGFAYTRYADDLTFSGDAVATGRAVGGAGNAGGDTLGGAGDGQCAGQVSSQVSGQGAGAKVGWLLRGVRAVLSAEGFREHPTKTRVMRRGGRQEVTGVTVNDRPKLVRRELRALRAVLHNAARDGLASQNHTHRPDFAAWLRGKVAYACMLDPTRAGHWRVALARALGAAER